MMNKKKTNSRCDEDRKNQKGVVVNKKKNNDNERARHKERDR